MACEKQICGICAWFSAYMAVLLDSHWNQWDSFQQLPWSLAGSLNCLLKQGKINRAVGSSSADDWIDTLKFPSTFGEEAGKGQECRGGSCSADEQTAAFFLSDSFRASEEFHPMIFTVWCSGFDDLDPERTAYTPVENDTFLQRQNHFSFRADLGPRQLGHITVTDPASWASGGLCNQALCVKSLHALMVISPAAGTPHFFGIRRGSPELFTEELLLTHTAHRGQIPLHWPGGLANFSRDICITNQFHGLPFKEGCTLNYLVWISQVAFWSFSWPVLMPRGCSSECCSTTEQKDKNLLKKLQSNQEEFPGVLRSSESVWPGDKQRFLWLSLLPCAEELQESHSWFRTTGGLFAFSVL